MFSRNQARQIKSNITSAYESSVDPSAYSRADNPVVFLDIADVDGENVNLLGRLNIELRKDICPAACNNFLSLVKGDLEVIDGIHFCYKNTRIHRIVKDVLFQGGDLQDLQGECSRSIYNHGGYFKDENFILRHTGAGCLSYVNKGPDSNGSIFQITLTQNELLDSSCVVFGCVACEDSLDVLSKINLYGNATGEPSKVLRITDCGVI
jgi:cyclophilin family peptidyl-prolyl cis-trans isomerase